MIVHHYEKELIVLPSYYLHKKLLQIVPPILIAIGTTGNALSFLVMKRHASRIPMYSYLCVLSVLDLLVLYVGLLRLWVAQLWDVDPRNASNWMCKLVVFLGYVCSDASVWTIVTVTVERFFAICKPFYLRSVFTSKRFTKLWLFAPIVVFSAVNCHFFFTVQLRTVHNVSLCYSVDSYDFLVHKTWPWIDAALYSFVPTIIISVLNAKIVLQFIRAKKRRKLLKTHEHISDDSTKRRNNGKTSNRKFTVMMLMVSMSFLVTTLPNNTVLIITAVWNDYGTSAENIALFTLIKTITELLMYTNHAINFFLYCASGRKFRTQLVDMCPGSKMSSRYDSDNTLLNVYGSVKSTRNNGIEMKEARL